jgi:hypothetical protein
MKRTFFCVAFLCGLIGCSKVAVENPTDQFLKGQKLSKLENNQLEEISGGAASVNNPGLFWLHNDSGNSADLYLVDDSLRVLFTCSIPVENRDWEDMAIGPGPQAGKSYIYLGEIGDNDSKYSQKYIYRFEEPQWDKASKTFAVTDVDTITFQLEDRNKDTETLMIDPASSDLYIISKRDDPNTLYQIRYPYSTDSTVIAKKLFNLPFTQIVSGDFSPDGKGILIKNYEHVYYWENTNGISVPELMKQQPREVPYEKEPQGETIMWARDNSGFYTVSEINVGKNSYLYLYKNKDFSKKPE